MDLTTLERVTLRLLAENKDRAQPNNTSLLSSLITQVSDGVERYLGRGVQSLARTEYHDIDEYQRIVSLRSWPVSAVTSVSWSHDATTWTAYILGSDYLNPVLRTDGQLHFIGTPLCGSHTLRIIYTAGMAASTAAFVLAYPDLAGAVDAQVVHEFQRRLDRGLLSIGGVAGNTTFEVGEFIGSVREVLARYRRPVLGN